MNRIHDQRAITAVLNAVGRLTAAEIAKTLGWTRTRARKALCDLEQQGAARHNHDRSWEATK